MDRAQSRELGTLYSGPPVIMPPLGNGKSGLIGGVASREGYFKYNNTEFVL